MRTALSIVPRGLPPELEELYRSSYPNGVERGLPLHVTLLFPWVPVEQLDELQLARARSVFARFEPFALAFERLDEFPEVLWAAPEPAGRVRALIEALAEEFPEHPPYEGQFTDPIPHATIAVVDAESQAREAAALRARLDPLLPVGFEVGDVALLEEYETDRWRVRQRLALGRAAP